MPKPTETPEPTGNAALDSALTAIHEIRSTYDAKIDEIVKAGGAVDNRIAAIEERADKAVEEIGKVAERLATLSVAPVELDRKDEKRDFSYGRLAQALYAEVNGTRREKAWEDAGFEREMVETGERAARAQIEQLQRVMGTIDDETGGVLVPTVGPADFISLLRAKLVLPTLGARVLPNLVGHRLPIPGLSSGASAAWYGESEEPTASELKFKVRYLNPHRVACFVPVANNLLRWSAPAVDGIIREDMAATLALKIEDGALLGSGAEDAPLGAVNDPDVGTVTLGPDANTGGRFSLRDVPDFEIVLEEANLDIGDSAGFLFHPRVKRLLKKEGVAMFSGQSVDEGMPYITPAVADARIADLLGYRFATTTALPTNLTKGTGTDLTYVIMALWNQFILGMWGGVRFRASTESGNSSLGSAFLKDQTWIVAETLADGLLRRPEAMVVCSDALKN